jgi:hypothetical protein
MPRTTGPRTKLLVDINWGNSHRASIARRPALGSKSKSGRPLEVRTAQFAKASQERGSYQKNKFDNDRLDIGVTRHLGVVLMDSGASRNISHALIVLQVFTPINASAQI